MIIYSLESVNYKKISLLLRDIFYKELGYLLMMIISLIDILFYDVIDIKIEEIDYVPQFNLVVGFILDNKISI
ncbi:hypothetical protein J1C67_16240 [Clostridium gasigenes]|uniref:hypothetical protein n=1 Tax=Clostridium gasigenes TaxID=94869 RepID=UPI0014386BB0|nr:hypothetical protein [Clostridium gasigenes]NKF05634.1 hypothetical protein [Clostridium gasigenes]QSW19073.1 hypothetical protein J1C67_16240 [Clostridium gasigenes]